MKVHVHAHSSSRDPPSLTSLSQRQKREGSASRPTLSALGVTLARRARWAAVGSLGTAQQGTHCRNVRGWTCTLKGRGCVGGGKVAALSVSPLLPLLAHALSLK